MSDPYPGRSAPGSLEREDKRSFLQRLAEFIHPGPDSRAELIETLNDAEQNDIIGPDARVMLEGVIRMADQTAGDVMVAATRMDCLDIDAPYEELLHQVINTAHSRFPVYEGERENIIGILLAKDLLRCMLEPGIEVRTLVRPAVFIPESKRLNVLLHEFRASRNHQAIVIDEHGGISGLVTMEDVLEQIVGDIEDEFDETEEDSIFPEGENQWRVLAATDISHFNDVFGCLLPDDEYDSVGGWMGGQLGRIPRRGDVAEFDGLKLEVARGDARRAIWLRVKRVAPSRGVQPDSDA